MIQEVMPRSTITELAVLSLLPYKAKTIFPKMDLKESEQFHEEPPFFLWISALHDAGKLDWSLLFGSLIVTWSQKEFRSNYFWPILKMAQSLTVSIESDLKQSRMKKIEQILDAAKTRLDSEMNQTSSSVDKSELRDRLLAVDLIQINIARKKKSESNSKKSKAKLSSVQ
ncbi:hypothetical protein Ciccas_001956 [Cichlidogyrus casuarinus]|uniref:Uncharacterized protein n=1 Tax=Cichlidogyrus casuarinus TaxID=1844966 RepID=A0ABD2QIL2_9PLAT